MVDPRFQGLDVPLSDFEGDDGSADPALRAAIAASTDVDADQESLRAVQHALVGTRVLVPVVAALGEVEVDDSTGLTREKTSDMAAATFEAAAGWRGVLAFTGVDALRAWRVDARPVPMHVEQAALGALETGVEALVLDLAGPQPCVLSGSLLRATAAGRAALPPGEDPDVAATVLSAALSVDGVEGAWVGPAGDLDVDVQLVVTVGEGTGPDLGERVGERLAAEPLLRDRLDRGVAVVVDR